MTLTDFDYAAFAKSMATQTKEVIPEDIDAAGKAYITNLVFNYCNLAGEALANDPQGVLDAQQATIVCQFIGEWTFHKAIDVIRGNIPVQARDETLQKVAFTVFEIAKLALSKGMPLDNIISLVEEHVKKTFTEAVEDLSKKGVINDDVAKGAISQSNIDIMAQNMQQEREQEAQRQKEQQAVQEEIKPQPQPQPQPQSDSIGNRTFKLASLALVLKSLPANKAKAILKKFNRRDADIISQYMQMPDLNQKVDANTAIQCLKEIKTSLPSKRATTPNQLIFRIKNSLQNVPRENLELFLKQERINVKRFVTTALQDELYELPPKVANVIAQHIESSV